MNQLVHLAIMAPCLLIAGFSLAVGLGFVRNTRAWRFKVFGLGWLLLTLMASCGALAAAVIGKGA